MIRYSLIKTGGYRVGFICVCLHIAYSCSSRYSSEKYCKAAKIEQLTASAQGHMLHHNNVFSFDDRYIVFDGRNDETEIGQTSVIGVVDLKNGEEKIIYETSDPKDYGPGVGAASFHPNDYRVVFIHGLKSASMDLPYDITRRVGVEVHLESPQKKIHLDARDIISPYLPGSLRGGTHSHMWSGDGDFVSFTYNDEKTDPHLRSVGVMFPTKKGLTVKNVAGNNNGSMYAVLISEVKDSPEPGSDEIDKAFDECWVGKSGYIDANHQQVEKAVAFQGNTKSKHGDVHTEIFIVDIDTTKINLDIYSVHEENGRPRPPDGIVQRRLSYTQRGLSDLRHWLRSSPDGQFIYALAKDNMGNNQIISCHTQSGEVTYLSAFDFSIDSPINIDEQGDCITFIAKNNVYVFDIEKGRLWKLTDYSSGGTELTGAPVFSRNGKMIAFNRLMEHEKGKEYLQIFVIYL